MQNLPSAIKLDKDGNGNIFDKTIGKALNATTDYGTGIIPTVGNAGGYVTQIATQLFGDNRGIIKTANKQDLLNMGISPEDLKNSSPHSGYVCVIGCRDSMVTPDKDRFINISGESKPLSEFYEERNLKKGN